MADGGVAPHCRLLLLSTIAFPAAIVKMVDTALAVSTEISTAAICHYAIF
jgi:hypothetical protein